MPAADRAAAPADPPKPPMTIVELRAENVKKLRAVAIRPAGPVVEISGRNGQGKTSVLDAIWWALTGTSNIQAVPIRAGEEEAVIRLDLGPIRVIRTFRQRDGEPWTTSLKVENTRDGAAFRSPQTLLDALVGELAFDPLEFSKLKPADQFEALQRFVPDVDFAALDRADEDDAEARRLAKRDLAADEARRAAIVVPDDLPEVAVDVGALVRELNDAGVANGLVERRRAGREEAAAKVARDIAGADRLEGSIRSSIETLRSVHNTDLGRIDAEIERLTAARAAEVSRAEKALAERQHDMEAQVAAIRAEADRVQTQLDTAEPLPPLVDTEVLMASIGAAEAINAGIVKRNQRNTLDDRIGGGEAEVKRLTKALEARARQRQQAIAEARMPVPGLGFGRREVLLGGLPFAQASHAEQLRASIAIAMASNPRLRVLRVTQGSDLDQASFDLLGTMATEAGYQVWVETVQSGRDTAVVIEDGAVVGSPLAADARAGKGAAA